jgi:LysM repeat protein
MSVFSQTNSNRFFSSRDEIVIDILPGNDIFYSHIVDKGSTIYSLARVFQVNTAKVYKLNNLNPELPINEGKTVKLPISSGILVTDYLLPKSKKPYLEVYYVIKKGESLYRVSKTYLDIPVEVIRKLNNKSNNDIQVGEKLLVGYILLDASASNIVPNNLVSNIPKTQLTPVKVADLTIEKDEEIVSPPVQRWYSSNVIAQWDKRLSESKSLYVLHNEAKVGSTMEIYFPMLRSQVKAKVIGAIPEGTYNDDVALFISPSVAKDLGILDSRSMLSIKYEK